MHKFNVTGTCVPWDHYMVDISNKLEQIKAMVDAKDYFTINRGRQYGKTTTLLALEEFLKEEYIVISISFEGLGKEEFASAVDFCQFFLKQVSKALRFSSASKEYQEQWKDEEVKDFDALDDHITDMSEGKKLVLMIDKVDQVSNNFVFLSFLGMLRKKYLARSVGKDFTFYSVILVGVYDIRNIKLKLIQEGLYTPTEGESTIRNSPWNIAASFDVDMSFSPPEIETMLVDYEADHKTGMNIVEVAKEIHSYTSGYPYLVTRICKLIDEKLEKSWNALGIREAVQLVLKESSPLFEHLVKNLESNQELSDLVYNILMIGGKWRFSTDTPAIALGIRYGYFKELDGRVKIANKIFEMRITNYFINRDQIANLQLDPTSGTSDDEGIIKEN